MYLMTVSFLFYKRHAVLKAKLCSMLSFEVVLMNTRGKSSTLIYLGSRIDPSGTYETVLSQDKKHCFKKITIEFIPNTV